VQAIKQLKNKKPGAPGL